MRPRTVSEQRTYNYVKQIKASFVFKGLAIAASFIAVPLMIRYLGQEQFGIWSTLLSIMSWIVFFDLGIGNGLRNKVAEALAKNNISLASAYISSGYSFIGLISSGLLMIAATAVFYIPWQSVFNTQNINEQLLKHTVLISVFFIILNFWISLINQVLNAAQKSSAVVFGQFMSNILALIFVVILIKLTSPSLYYLAFTYGATLVISNSILSLWFYQKRCDLMPRLSLDIRHIRPILSLGLQFFTIQLAVLVIFTTDKILITQLFGPSYVTQYEVVFKLFGIITLTHTLITTPLWSSYTDAYHRSDFIWIKSALRKQLMLFLAIIFSVVILVVIAKPIIALWIGEDLEISMPLVISMGVFIIISTWSTIFAYVVNGVGKIGPQVCSSCIAMLINIPLAIYFTKYLSLGIHGIVLATCTSLSLFSIIGPIQVYMLLKAKDTSCLHS